MISLYLFYEINNFIIVEEIDQWAIIFYFNFYIKGFNLYFCDDSAFQNLAYELSLEFSLNIFNFYSQ
jgi:hypothetical protein